MSAFSLLSSLLLACLCNGFSEDIAEEHNDSCATVQELEKMLILGRRKSSYSISTKSLKAEDFAGKHSDIASVMNTFCGVTIRRTGGIGTYSDMSIRGSGSNQVQVYLDGLPLNSATGGAVDLSKIPLNQIREITLYNTSAPIEFGGLNAGGVVELSTNPQSGNSVVTGLTEIGTYGYMKAGAFLGKTHDFFTNRLSVDYAHSDNDFPYIYDPTLYKDGDESTKYIDNQDFTSVNAVYTNAIFMNSSRHSLQSQLSIDGTRNGLFNYETPDFNDGYSRDRIIALTEEYSGMLSEMLFLRVNLSARHKENIFQREKPYYIGNSRKLRTDYPYLGGWTTGHLVFNKTFSLKGLIGGSYEGYHEHDMWSNEPDNSYPYAERLIARAGLEAECSCTNMLFARCMGTIIYEIDSTNGIYLQHESRTGNPHAIHDYLPSVQGEIRFESLFHLDFSLSGIYCNRSPSLSEKFARGNKYYGNDDLVDETRMEGELGISLNTKNISSSLVGYHGKTLDKIKWIAQSQNIFVPENIESVKGTGVEWNLTLTPWNWLTVSNALSLMHNIIESDQAYWDGNYEPLLPALKERCEVRFFFRRVSLGHSLLYSSCYYLGPQNIEYIDPGINLGFNISLVWFENMELTYRLDNYLDKVDYTSVGHEYFERLPKPGRMHYGIIRMTM